MMVVAEFSCGGLFFFNCFFMKRRRDREKEERGEEKRERGEEINILMNR